MSQAGLFVRWVVEQPAWLAPLVGAVGIGVGLLMGIPKQPRRRHVAVAALCGLVALFVAELGGRVGEPSVVCFDQWPPECREIAGVLSAGVEDVGAGSWISGADHRAGESAGSVRVEVPPPLMSAAGGGGRTQPSAGAAPSDTPSAPAEGSNGRLS